MGEFGVSMVRGDIFFYGMIRAGFCWYVLDKNQHVSSLLKCRRSMLAGIARSIVDP